MTTNASQSSSPGRVTFLDGQNEMTMVEVSTVWSTAEIYLHGAHVTRFQKKGEAPLLFLSQCSRFADGQPIRGGIPVIFPWFGMREGLGQHGYVRNHAWDIKEVVPAQDGRVSVRFRLPEYPEAGTFPPFAADFVVTVSQELALELVITNVSKEEAFTFEDCLHTYFEVGDISAVSIHGLKGVDYLDKVANFARKTEAADAIRISSEVDRVYLDTKSAVEIVDPRLGRRIRVEKEGSSSTVVWNPWVAKARQMPDFGNEEYQTMVCVESGNVGDSAVTLGPGQSHALKVRLGSSVLT